MCTRYGLLFSNIIFGQSFVLNYITNLTSHDLVMEIVLILSFIIRLFHALISCIENTFDTQIYITMCDIHSFISLYFICQFIHVSNMFSMHDICV
jgi:hypothetical protein